VPGRPLSFELTSNEPSQIIAKWNEPSDPNGRILHYQLLYKQAIEIFENFSRRKRCAKHCLWKCQRIFASCLRQNVWRLRDFRVIRRDLTNRPFWRSRKWYQQVWKLYPCCC